MSRLKARNPLSSSPLDAVLSCVWGKKSPFSLPLHRLILVHWHNMRSWLMDCVSVMYRTVPVVSALTCILYCTVKNCFKFRQLIENKVFYPQGGCGGQKMFSFRHRRHLGDSPFPAKEGGGGQERLCKFWISLAVLSSFYYFFGVRGASSKTIKTGLNCRHSNFRYKEVKNTFKIFFAG